MATYEILVVGADASADADLSDLITDIEAISDGNTYNCTYHQESGSQGPPANMTTNYQVLVLTADISSANADKYFGYDIPMFHLEWDESGGSGGGVTEDLWTGSTSWTLQTQGTIRDITHPIAVACGWDTVGETLTFNGPSDRYQGTAISNWGSGAVELVRRSGSTETICATYEDGATEANSVAAPNRRAALGWNSGVHGKVTADGRLLTQSCVRWLAGALDVASEIELDATIACTSDFTADLQVTKNLASTVDVAFTLAGSLVSEKLLAAQSDMVSTLSADVQLDKELDSDITVVSTFEGSLQADKLLASTIALQSGLTGGLTAEKTMDSQIDMIFTFTGTLSEVTPHNLESQIDVSLTTSPVALLVEKFLASQSDMVSTLSADLQLSNALASTIDVTSGLTAELQSIKLLTASIDSVSTFNATLEVGIELASQINIASALSADIELSKTLASTVELVSGFISSLEVEKQASSTIAMSSGFSGTLDIGDGTVVFDLSLLHVIWDRWHWYNPKKAFS